MAAGKQGLQYYYCLAVKVIARSGPDDVLAIIERSVAPWSVSWSVSWSVPLSVECLGVCLRATIVSQSCRRVSQSCSERNMECLGVSQSQGGVSWSVTNLFVEKWAKFIIRRVRRLESNIIFVY